MNLKNLCCATIFMLLSCHKSDRIINLSSGLKYTIGIDKGSILVFRDSITLELDTMRVATYQNEFIPNSDNTEKIETAKYALESVKHISVNPQFRIHVSANAKTNRISAWLVDHVDSPNVDFTAVRLYSEPFVFETRELTLNFNDNVIPFKTVTNIPLQKLDSMIVNGIIHTNLYENLVVSKLSNTNKIDSLLTIFSMDGSLIKFRVVTDNFSFTKELVYQNLIRK